jgi:signal peptidase II
MPSAADRRVFVSAAAVVVVLDAITKYLAELHLGSGAMVRVLGDWVRLHLVYNRGAAFGLHLGDYSRWIFLAIAIIAVVVLYRMSREAAPGDRFRQLALGLVAGGAAGNLIDRIRSSRGVVDFLDVGIGALRWPTFNVADIAVSCGAIALALSLWREDARRPAPESASAG